MVLVIDIGNTNIVPAIFKGDRLVKESRIPTDTSKKPQYYEKVMIKFIKSVTSPSQIQGAIISSVVPKALRIIKQALIPYFNQRIFILGEDVKVPIENKYLRPTQVGQDRLVNAFALLNIYKRTPAIIVDFGTAVTIDLISKKGTYLGGVIAPGVELSIENLTRRAALLPKINLRRPKNILGKSTAESMLSGIFYGYASLCDGVIEKLAKKFKTKPFVLATGGHAKLLSSYCKRINKIDTHLTSKGLNKIYSFVQKITKINKNLRNFS